jgi:hypothetical protein
VVAGGARFEDGDADVDGVTLVAVAGDRPAQLDVLGDIPGGEDDLPPVGVDDGERSVLVDGSDGPGVAVADLLVSVGSEVRVVAAGGDLVPLSRGGAISEPPWS